jgi:hypothetical protein
MKQHDQSLPAEFLSVNMENIPPSRRMYSLGLLMFLLIEMPSPGVHAQSLIGYNQSLHAGVAGASSNPATLADHFFSMDILLGGASVEMANNYIGIRRADIRRPGFGAKYFYLHNSDTKKAAFFRGEVLLPGIMFSNEKSGWGIDLKLRTYFNADGIERELAHFLAFSLNDPPNFNMELSNQHIGINAMSWMEIGAAYAKTVSSSARCRSDVCIHQRRRLRVQQRYHHGVRQRRRFVWTLPQLYFR